MGDVKVSILGVDKNAFRFDATNNQVQHQAYWSCHEC